MAVHSEHSSQSGRSREGTLSISLLALESLFPSLGRRYVAASFRGRLVAFSQFAGLDVGLRGLPQIDEYLPSTRVLFPKEGCKPSATDIPRFYCLEK